MKQVRKSSRLLADLAIVVRAEYCDDNDDDQPHFCNTTTTQATCLLLWVRDSSLTPPTSRRALTSKQLGVGFKFRVKETGFRI